jgi:hypothetical protein
MPARPQALLLVALGVALAVIAPGEPAKPGVRKRGGGRTAAAQTPRPATGWTDAKFLEEEFERGCEYARQATGRRFPQAPSVVLAEPAEVATLLERDLGGWLRTHGADVGGAARDLARFVPVWNDLDAHKVLVSPAAVEGLREVYKDPSLLPQDACRLLLVYAAVRDLDAQIVPELASNLRERRDRDGIEAAWAVAIGHAWFRTQYVAGPTNLKLAPEFDALTALFSSAPGDTTSETLVLLAEFGKQTFVKGLAFVRAVYEKNSPAVAEALGVPPATFTEIERSDLWLASRKLRKAFADERVLKEVRALVEAEGWSVGTVAVARSEAEQMVSATDPAVAAPVLDAFRQGERLVATHSESGAEVRGVLLLFASPAHAEEFGRMRRLHDKEMPKRLKDTPTEILESRDRDGTGRDQGQVGYTVEARHAHPEGERSVRTQVSWIESFVIQLEVVGEGPSQEEQADAFEAAFDVILKLTEPETRRR